MNDLKIAHALQHDILGPGKWGAPCGCILNVIGNFPKKPWIYNTYMHHSCHFDCTNAYGPTCLQGWISKLTATRVSREEFADAWLKAKKRYSVINELLVPVSRYTGTGHYEELDALRLEDIGLEPVREWPPKMAEVFKALK